MERDMSFKNTLGCLGKKISKGLHQPTIYRSRNPTLNRIGLQSIRMFIKALQYRFKRAPSNSNYVEHKAKLEAEGMNLGYLKKKNELQFD
jgi:hypothetical protein